MNVLPDPGVAVSVARGADVPCGIAQLRVLSSPLSCM